MNQISVTNNRYSEISPANAGFVYRIRCTQHKLLSTTKTSVYLTSLNSFYANTFTIKYLQQLIINF